MFSQTAHGAAGDWHLVSLDRFAMEQYQIVNNRDAYFPYKNPPSDEEHWKDGIAAMFDLDLVKYKLFDLYYRGRVHGETTDKQFRQVGLQFETGVEIKDYLNIFWFHHSQHLLDAEPVYGYPLQNFVGARVTFYKRDR